MQKERTLSRDLTATQIPSGDKHRLPAGTKIYLHQSLGGSFTVQTDFGLYRIDGSDGDAIGETVADHRIHTETLEDGSPNPEAIWDQLKKVYDPEIPVNIVDLGLVYSMDIEKIESANTTSGGTTSVSSAPAYKVSVALTLTAPGCGMGPAIADDAKSKVLLVPGVSEADVRITWEPPWNQSMISEEGKMKLGLI
jgi:probable FeS assembly SUF system protein SufT